MNNFEKSKQSIADASKYLPGGTNSNFRLGMAPTPLVFERGEGPYLYAVDGNQLIDYYAGMGPMMMSSIILLFYLSKRDLDSKRNLYVHLETEHD